MNNCLFEDFWAPFWQLLGTIWLHFGRLGEYEFGVNFQSDSFYGLAGWLQNPAPLVGEGKTGIPGSSRKPRRKVTINHPAGYKATII